MTSAFRAAAAAAALAGLAACAPTQPGLPHDGTGFEGGVPFGTYTIVGFGQEAVPTRDGHVRLTPGQITGQGPCNSFTATNTATLPQIHVSQMHWTDNPCGHKGFEARFFEALTQASAAEWTGGVLKIQSPLGWMTLERSGN